MIKIYKKYKTIKHSGQADIQPPYNCVSWMRLFYVVWRAVIKRKVLVFSLLFLLVTLPIFFLVVKYQSKIEAAWYDDAWGYRQTVDITNSGTAQTDFQIAITLDTSALITAGKIQSDCDDIRITDINGKLLPYWIETGTNACNTTTTAIWTKVPSIAVSGATVFLYYGNSTVSHAQNGAGVFEFFDDFNGASLNTSKWNTTGTSANGQITVQSGYVKMYNTQNETDKLNSTLTFVQQNYILESNLQMTSSTGGDLDGQAGWNGGVRIGLGPQDNEWEDPHKITVPATVQGAELITSSWKRWSLTAKSGAVKSVFGSETLTTAATHTYASTNLFFLSNVGNNALEIDFVALRKYAATEPVIASPANEEKGGAPIAYWKFDEGQGTTAYDSTENVNNGTISGATWKSEDQCVNGKCLEFNGSSSYVDLGDNYGFEGRVPYTLQAWIKTTTFDSGWRRFLSKHKTVSTLREGWLIWTHLNGSTRQIGCERFVGGVGNGSTSVTSNSIVLSGQWMHVVCSFDGTYSRLYVNGKLAGTSSAATLDLIDNDGSVTVGRDSGGGNYFNGQIDDVKIYPYARTAAQIKTDYASKGGGAVKGTSVQMGTNAKNNDAFSNGLVGYWKMDDSSGNAIDSSGNSNTGTVTGTPTSVVGTIGPAKDFANTAGVAATDYYNVTATTGLSADAITVSAWINPDVIASGERQCFINTPGTFFDIEPGGSLIAYIQTTPTGWIAQSTTGLQAGVWQHVVQTYDRKTRNLYINGVLKSSATDRTEALINTGATRIGDAAWGGEAYDGKIQHVRIYNRALTGAEVNKLYSWAPGPVGYYKLDEGTGSSTYDSSSLNHNSVSMTNTTWTNGKFGKAVNFNGTNTSIVVGDNADYENKNFTLEAWVYPNGNSSAHKFILARRPGAEDVYYWDIDDSNKLRLVVYDPTYNGASSTTTVPQNQWSHVVVTYEQNGTAYFYINGIKDATTFAAGSSLNLTSTKNMYFGMQEGGSYPFAGKIDDVRIYNYARTPGQIIEDMNAGHPLGGSPIGSQIGYWKFDEGYESTANNSGNLGSSLNGTLDNATWSMDGKYGKAISCELDNSEEVDINSSTVSNETELTVSAWIKPESHTTTGGIIGEGGAYRLYISTAGKLRFFVNGNPSDTSSTLISANNIIVNGVWQHVAAVWNGSNATWGLYYNGKRITDNSAANNTTSFDGADSDNPAICNYWNNYASARFDGLIDEVKLYSSALTADEIKLDYNRGSAMVLGTLSDTSGLTGGSVASSSASAAYCVPGSSDPCSPPVAYYPFENHSNDTSGSGLNFTTTKSYTTGKIGKSLIFEGGTTGTTSSTNILDNDTHTIQFWIKFTGYTAGWQGIFNYKPTGSDRSPGIWRNTSGRMLHWRYDAGNTGTDIYLNGVGTGTQFSDETWYHITGTKEGSTFKAYVNGNYVGTTTVANPKFAGSSPLYFGSAEVNIDEFKLFNYARTPAQIAWDYNQGKPIAHWKLDECQGITANDSSGNGNSGTITIGATIPQTTGGTCTTPTDGTGAWYNGRTGKYNSSLNFDGVDDYVQIGNNLSLPTTGLTISAWIKVASLANSTNYNIFSKQTWGSKLGFRLALSGYGGCANLNCLFLGVGDGVNQNETASTIYLTDTGIWHHVVGTFSSGSVKMYLDGNQKYSTSYTVTSIVNDAVAARIGKHSTGNEPFPGQIDDVQIYNYALTPQQVKMVYNEGSAVRFGPVTGSP